MACAVMFQLPECMRKTRAFFLDLLAQNVYICGNRKFIRACA